MEKRIPFFHFQSVKAVAKAIDPHLKTLDSLKKKALALKEEYEEKQAKLKRDFDEKAGKVKQEFDAEMTQINALESGILQVTGCHVAELVKKVIEPTGKTDPKTGKPIKVTKYVPTDMVSYDESSKEFIVAIPDGDMPAGEDMSPEPTEVPSTEEEIAGSDYDKDAEEYLQSQEAAEESSDDNDLPFM